jgi:hypothetical protein
MFDPWILVVLTLGKVVVYLGGAAISMGVAIVKIVRALAG